MTQTNHDLGNTRDIDVIDQFLDVKDLYLIDIGCGNMGLSKALAKRGARVLGIDPDPIQAEKNRTADAVENVEFKECGADSIPVEDGSVDGVIFPYSLHHIPSSVYPAVFRELDRILKDQGFVYVMEPVAAGDLNEVMRLFHDEAEVRQAAQRALDTLAIPRYSDVSHIHYRIPLQYASWDEYEAKYVGSSYNTASYTSEQVQDAAVKARFLALGEPTGFRFESPMKVTYLRGQRISQLEQQEESA